MTIAAPTKDEWLLLQRATIGLGLAILTLVFLWLVAQGPKGPKT